MTTEDKNTAETPSKKKKAPPAGLVIPPPKPKLTKAERRALQEQQRAAKAGKQQQQQQGKKKKADNDNDKSGKPQQQGSTKSAGKAALTEQKGRSGADQQQQQSDGTIKEKTVSLVSHLTPYRAPVSYPSVSGQQQHLHPAVLETGRGYATGSITGANERCRAMLHCYLKVLQDYKPPNSTGDLRQAIDHQVLKPAFHYWTDKCRPHSVSMGNAFTFLKTFVASLDRDLEFDAMRQILQEIIQAYERERIDFADRVIAETVCQKLLQDSGEVILTYGYSEVIAALLQKAASVGKKFRVIIVDSRPVLEGRKLLDCLRAADIESSYVLLNALTYVLQDVTKVLLGAAALMSDGSVYGRVGTGCVAMAAHTHHIPVLICSETYKISNRVQLESITGNELGNPDTLSDNSQALLNWKESSDLKLLNLVYDLTPSSFVSGIVTELGIVPPTSVAVLLREMNPQDVRST